MNKRNYLPPMLEFFKLNKDVVTASIEGVYDEVEGDKVSPNAGFWS